MSEIEPVVALTTYLGPTFGGHPDYQPCMVFMSQNVMDELHSGNINVWQLVLECCEDHVKTQLEDQ